MTSLGGIYTPLDKLLQKYGAKTFGRISQIFLALALKDMGFNVRNNEVGRPDIIASKTNQTLLIEARTSEKDYVIIKNADLFKSNGVNDVPLLAILDFPSPFPMWKIIEAETITAGKFLKSELNSYSASTLESEINKKFPEIVERYFEETFDNLNSLKQHLSEEN